MARPLDCTAETLADVEGETAERDLEQVRKLQRLYDRSERALSLLTNQVLERVTGLLDRFLDQGEG